MPGEPISTLIVFCDYVIVEGKTGKVSLIGTFSRLVSPRFPFQIQKLFIATTIANFTPAGKEMTIVVNIKQKNSGAVVGSAAMPITIQPPTGPTPASGMHLNLNVPFQNLVFPAPGDYVCEILFDGEVIGSRILDLILKSPPSSQPPAIP